MTLQTSTLNTTKVKAPTPMIAQYLRVKEKHTDSLLLYRMGDFYEMFFEDARIGSETLGIALTKRGVKDGQDIPMCGVPVHSVEGYLSRLIKAGHKISICEQIEDPETQKKRGGKGPLRREVVRVLTAGTLVEDQLLQARRHNYLAALGRSGSEIAISWADMSTGDFFVQETNSDQIETMLARIDPAELIYPEDFVLSEELKSYFGVSSFCLSKQLSSIFDVKLARNSLEMFYGLTSLDGLGQFSNSMLSAAGGLLTYLERTQVGNAPRLTTIKPVSESSFMEIDPATRRSLELRQSLSGEFHGSLVSALDFTQTAAGGRLLDERLAAPLIDISEINLRLDWVEWFLTEAACRNNVRGQLQVQPDIDRAFSRLSLGRGGPRDLASITNGILGAREIARTMDESIAEPCQKQLKVPSNLRLLMQTILAPGPLVEILEPALSDELPLLTRDGGFIRSGYNQELDALRSLRDKSRVLIVDLQKLYVEKTGISSLKIKHNNVLGFHVDVRSNHAEKLMNDDTFIHRQTTAQAVRFTTTELGELEHGIVSAADRILTMELKIFCDLLDRVKSFTDKLIAAAQALAEIDVAAAAALLAETSNYCRPELTDDCRFKVIGGRHPVVEKTLSSQSPFISNDCDLDSSRLWLLTGPNMAGKSTFLRQNAHIAIMAQAGFFVPAKSAVIGIIDRLFSRVGAADDLARGRSTFMVEMVETAVILNRATAQSFVILDEIGRGTATYDGLSIAWSAIEFLHDVSDCRTLFATHYHELTQLQKRLKKLDCYAMAIKEWESQIVFLHKVISGTADRSYGVHVARLAGLPKAVLERADTILAELERGQHGIADIEMLIDNLPLFEKQKKHEAGEEKKQKILYELNQFQPDDHTPKEALEFLYRLRELMDLGPN